MVKARWAATYYLYFLQPTIYTGYRRESFWVLFVLINVADRLLGGKNLPASSFRLLGRKKHKIPFINKIIKNPKNFSSSGEFCCLFFYLASIQKKTAKIAANITVSIIGGRYWRK